jgi:lipopolysaccharide biosynthesis regulator YciM
MFQQFWQWFLEPVNQRWFLGLIAAFLMGLVFGRVRGGQRKGEESKGPSERDKAFYKGVQYILSNDHDHAIEEFTKSVQLNSDTIETYVALGNLYRSKGDIDRAIRIRQSIILRPNIEAQIRIRALFDLGLDYRKGGFLTRALNTFEDVLKEQPSSIETLQEIEKIHEELKDWESAFSVRQRIARLAKGDHSHILAHHQTEMGKVFQERGDLSKAKLCFKKAISINEGCVDAYLHLGDLYFGRQEYKKAIATWKKVVRVTPRFTFLAYRRLEGAYSRMKDLRPVEDFLKECVQLNSDAFTHLALARYLHNEQDHDGALRELASALEMNPSFWEARQLQGRILLEQGRNEEALEAYGDLVSYLNFSYLKFQCGNCGFRPTDLQWQCPQCRKWDSISLVNGGRTDMTPNHAPPHSLPGLLQNDSEETS